jgi:hypothetical protein
VAFDGSYREVKEGKEGATRTRAAAAEARRACRAESSVACRVHAWVRFAWRIRKGRRIRIYPFSGLCADNQVFGQRLPRLLAFWHWLLHATSNRLLSGGVKRSATSSSFWWAFAGLHCEHLPASIVIRYFKQRTMSTSANGAAGAFGTGPSSGYNPKRFSFIFSMSTVVFAMFISNLSSHKIAHVHIYATTLLCVIF